MKAKVGASWCDLYYTYSSFLFFFLFLFSQYQFFETGWDLKKKKKNDIHRLSNFYNWLFICILYQWSFLYWKLKKKKSILEKKIVWPLNVASPWPGLEFGLLVVSSNFFCFCFFLFFGLFVSKRCLILILLGSLHVPHFVDQFQFRGGWDPLSRGKFHVSICAVHIV